MITALDANILIYVLDDQSSFSKAAQRLLKRLEKEADKVYISTLARTEILHQPYQISTDIGNQAKQLLDAFGFLTYLDTSIAIADHAAELCTIAGAKLKNIDAIHIATAIYAGASEFWTNDQQLVKVVVKGITIKLLSDAA